MAHVSNQRKIWGHQFSLSIRQFWDQTRVIRLSSKHLLSLLDSPLNVCLKINLDNILNPKCGSLLEENTEKICKILR